MPTPTWSDDRVTLLRSLWADGLSASQIARALGGVTRNAVIGKVHRLGLGGRATPSAPRRAPRAPTLQRRPSPRSAALPPAAKPASIASAAPGGPGLVRDLVQLGPHACKWPIGDPKSPDFSFCGQQAGGRYCTEHTRRGVRPGPAWRPDRDPIVKRALAGLI
jgi:GcrA cell cycle regulator